MARVDLNADMGESFGPWPMGNDEGLLEVVTSANIACGFHAGDWDTMASTMGRAAENGVGIGAHPGFPDLQGFGRRRMEVPEASLRNLVAYQVSAAIGMARRAGGEVRHVKLHGALSNMAMGDYAMARSCYEAVLEIDPDLIVMVLAGTVMEKAVRDLGCRWCGEIFADRGYTDEGTLVRRGTPGAMVEDPDEAAARMVEFVTGGAIISNNGTKLPAAIDTICLHGDGPTALPMAHAVHKALESAGVEVRMFDGRKGEA